MRIRPLFAALCLVTGIGLAPAADWPQWRGPNRDDVSQVTGLLKVWPKDGPKLAWTFSDAGVGYSGPAIVGDTLYSAGAEDGSDEEFVFAVDTKTGKRKWKTKFGRFFDNGWGGGPRGTPTVDSDRLYIIGGNGDLACLAAESGKIHWQKSLTKDLGGRVMGQWGYCESPLVDGEKLICCPGGSQGTMAALDKMTGKVIWRSSGVTDQASYSSAIVVEFDKVRQYVVLSRDGTISVAAKDGKLLWKNSVPTNNIAVIPTPIYHDGHVYVTSDYAAGCGLFKLVPDGPNGTKAEEVYRHRKMENHHGGVILVNDHVYGWSGNSTQRGRWVCQNFKSGEVAWDSEKFECGSIAYADGHFYCYGQTTGTVVLIEANPKSWVEKGRLTIPKQTQLRKPAGRIWTHPVIANGKLYLRDQDLLFCYDISEKRAAQ